MSWFAKLWHKFLAPKSAWAMEEVSDDGQLKVHDFNQAYAANLRTRLPLEITATLTDAEVVKLWVERRNFEQQTPKLEVIHSDITADGQVALRLEWNDAFIRLLQQRGFVGDTEDDLVQAYLHQVTRKTDEELFEAETSDIPLVPPTEDDIEAILDKTDPETLKQIEKSVRRRAAQRGRNRTLDRQ